LAGTPAAHIAEEVTSSPGSAGPAKKPPRGRTEGPGLVASCRTGGIAREVPRRPGR